MIDRRHWSEVLQAAGRAAKEMAEHGRRITMTNIIAFAPAFDTPGKKDATGAFQPEMENFLARLPPPRVFHFVDNRKPDAVMREDVASTLKSWDIRREVVAFFCHGLGRKIQFGFDVRNVDLLAKAIAGASTDSVRVVLYACNTGMASLRERYEAVGGDGGFADALRDALCRAGAVNCQVDAHTTAGHTTKNPYVRRFEGRGSPVVGVGGYMLVVPGSKLWRPWVKALRETNLRYEFPFLPVSAIHERLVRG